MILLLLILILVAIPFIGAASLPTNFIIRREVIIKRPQQQLFDYIKFLKNHIQFNKWTMTDPNQSLEYRGTDATVGFFAAWDSTNKSVGKGEQEISEITEGKGVKYTLRFVRPFEDTAGSELTSEKISDQETKVIWNFTGKRKYGTKIFHFIFRLENMLGKDLQTSLGNLKNLLEK